MSRHYADAISESDLVDARDEDVEPEPEKQSHYILAFTVVIFRGKAPRRQLAGCGQYVEASEHSPEPTCPGCREYVLQEAEEDIETYTELGFVRDARGIWVPKDERA